MKCLKTEYPNRVEVNWRTHRELDGRSAAYSVNGKDKVQTTNTSHAVAVASVAANRRAKWRRKPKW